MNFKKTALLLSLAGLFNVFSAEARESGSIVVTIRGQEIIQKSKEGIKIQEFLAKKQKEMAPGLQKQEQEVRAKEAGLQKEKAEIDKEFAAIEGQSKLLSADARAEKMERLQEKARKLEEGKAELERAYRRFQEDVKRFEQKMQALQQKEMGQFDEVIKNIINDVAKREGWDIVLMEESVVYASKHVSKTDVIIKELDEKHRLSSSSVDSVKNEVKALEKTLQN